MGILDIGIKETADAPLQGDGIGELLHGEAVYAVSGKVDTHAVPGLHCAVAHALVQEGHVGLGVVYAVHGRGDKFRRFPKAVGCSGHPAVAAVHHGRRHLKLLTVGGMPQVLALGVVDATEAELCARGPSAGILPGKAAANVVGLAQLVSGGELKDVHGEVPWLREHGTHHLGTVGKLKAKVPLQVQVLVGRYSLGLGLGAPQRLTHGRGAEFSGGEFSADAGLRLLADFHSKSLTGNVGTKLPKALCPY